MHVLQPLCLPRTTVAASVTLYLRDQIIAGTLQPGESLPEARLGAQLGVSRVPVREALRHLEREGLISFDRRGTARVCTFGPADIRELGLMRLALEPMAARLASKRLTSLNVQALKANLEELRTAKSLTDVTRLDVEFHRLVVEASGNQRLLVAWERLAAQFKVVMGQFHRVVEARTRATRETTLQSHLLLFQTLKTGSPKANQQLAQGHATGWLQGWNYHQGVTVTKSEVTL